MEVWQEDRESVHQPIHLSPATAASQHAGLIGDDEPCSSLLEAQPPQAKKINKI
jgi:hypothetical protein